MAEGDHLQIRSPRQKNGMPERRQKVLQKIQKISSQEFKGEEETEVLKGEAETEIKKLKSNSQREGKYISTPTGGGNKSGRWRLRGEQWLGLRIKKKKAICG